MLLINKKVPYYKEIVEKSQRKRLRQRGQMGTGLAHFYAGFIFLSGRCQLLQGVFVSDLPPVTCCEAVYICIRTRKRRLVSLVEDHELPHLQRRSN